MLQVDKRKKMNLLQMQLLKRLKQEEKLMPQLLMLLAEINHLSQERRQNKLKVKKNKLRQEQKNKL
jgi:uncharacterized membrane protein required for colicin V production